jgi:hypothetical protein
MQLVLLGLQVPEEAVNAGETAGSVPDNFPLLRGQFAVGRPEAHFAGSMAL